MLHLEINIAKNHFTGYLLAYVHNKEEPMKHKKIFNNRPRGGLITSTEGDGKEV